MVETKEFIYKRVNNIELVLRVYFLPNCERTDKSPAVVFYFGGGWERGTIEQFGPQSEFMALKGFICVTPEYRVRSKHNTTPFESVEDAKDALYWVWEHSDELGIDPERIGVAGGSAGGHLAACTAILQRSCYDSRQVYKIPKAMVLFNPVCDTSEKGCGYEKLGERKLELSPLHNLSKELPPALLFHGTGDQTVPYTNAVDFCSRMKELENECTLVPYEGRKHGFFNRGNQESEQDYLDTRDRMYFFFSEKLLY